MAYRTAEQRARRRRIESLIRLAAPALDLVLYAGDRLARVTGRSEIGPEPAWRPGLPPPAQPRWTRTGEAGREDGAP